MHVKRAAAILAVLVDEMMFTLLFFVILPVFGVHLPIGIYIGIMAILVTKDIIVIKLIWNVVVGPPLMGKEALIGKKGVTFADMDTYGFVRIDNELWKAETTVPLKKGEEVEVVDMDGLFLVVEPAVSQDG
jgi:membrane-bound serine protease (ClpP class)